MDRTVASQTRRVTLAESEPSANDSHYIDTRGRGRELRVTTLK